MITLDSQRHYRGRFMNFGCTSEIMKTIIDREVTGLQA
jgi:hypothetical protein